jgi:hypothetical protein
LKGKLISQIRIRIHINVTSWIRIRIHVQITIHKVWNMSLFEHFFKHLSLYLEARSPDPHQKERLDPDPHKSDKLDPDPDPHPHQFADD